MKKIAIAIVAAAFMSAPVKANTNLDSTTTSVIVPFELDQDKKKHQDGKKDKEEVKISDLPNNITAALNVTEYAGWEAKEAWKIKPMKAGSTK